MKPALLTGAALLMAVSSGVFAPGVSAQGASTQKDATQKDVTQSTPVPPDQSSAGQVAPRPPGLGHTDSARTGSQADAGGLFTNVPVRTGFTSKVVGLSVYNSENADIGTIKDIAFDANGVQAYIVGVGGFLGLGEHYVAVRPSAITINYDLKNDKWRASMNTNADQLKSAPEFKYSSASAG